MKHTKERTPDYILIGILLLYIIGYSLQSCWNRSENQKPKMEMQQK